MNNMKQFLMSLLKRKREFSSKPIIDPLVIKGFNVDPNNPYLVSFPRTGSHWLRMLAELYFEQPTLVRAFYFVDRTDFLFLHTHDLELGVERRNVIYLYREPVSTVYSQLQYHQEDVDDVQLIKYWADLYGQHLHKWLITENFTTKKTLVTYEEMRENLPKAFSKIVLHFGQTLDVEHFSRVSAQVTKEEVKRKTPHDEQVVQLSNPYHLTRDSFSARHGDFVWEILLKDRSPLAGFFETLV